VDANDGIPPEERKQVLQAIDEGLAAARRGEHVDAEEFANELLAEP
jgi:predicted transcriptional regulator